MGETYIKLPDGTLEISKVQDTIISIMTRDEIVFEITKIQAEVNHLNVSIAFAQDKKVVWEAKLAKIDEIK